MEAAQSISLSSSSSDSLVESSKFKTCNSTYINALNDDCNDDADDGDTEKHTEGIAADFADLEAGVFWGVISEAEECMFQTKVNKCEVGKLFNSSSLLESAHE